MLALPQDHDKEEEDQASWFLPFCGVAENHTDGEQLLSPWAFPLLQKTLQVRTEEADHLSLFLHLYIEDPHKHRLPVKFN